MLEILAGVVSCRNKSFDHLTSMVTARASMLSGCICILLSWDEERKKLIDHLKSMGIPTLALIIKQANGSADNRVKEPAQDESNNFHQLKMGKIQEGLMNI
jgi:hypothetical protein